MKTLTQTFFDRLGLPQTFALDAREVETRYLARSRELHPDYHQLGSQSEQRLSLELSAELNEAYATLRDPFRRAEYLLNLEGGPSAAEYKEMPEAFLEEMLELRMEIEELREAGDPDSPDRKAMEEKLSQRRNGMLEGVARQFAGLDVAEDRQPVLKDIRRQLNSVRYLRGLLRDLRAD